MGFPLCFFHKFDIFYHPPNKSEGNLVYNKALLFIQITGHLVNCTAKRMNSWMKLQMYTGWNYRLTLWCSKEIYRFYWINKIYWCTRVYVHKIKLYMLHSNFNHDFFSRHNALSLETIGFVLFLPPVSMDKHQRNIKWSYKYEYFLFAILHWRRVYRILLVIINFQTYLNILCICWIIFV